MDVCKSLFVPNALKKAAGFLDRPQVGRVHEVEDGYRAGVHVRLGAHYVDKRREVVVFRGDEQRMGKAAREKRLGIEVDGFLAVEQHHIGHVRVGQGRVLVHILSF